MNDVTRGPGRELDARVAVEVLGWRWRAFHTMEGWAKDIVPPSAPEFHWAEETAAPPHKGLPYKNSLHFTRMPHYSTDWAASSEVWEWLAKNGYYPALHQELYEPEIGDTAVWCDLSNPSISVLGRDVPHVICLAALAAVKENMIDENEEGKLDSPNWLSVDVANLQDRGFARENDPRKRVVPHPMGNEMTYTPGNTAVNDMSETEIYGKPKSRKELEDDLAMRVEAMLIAALQASEYHVRVAELEAELNRCNAHLSYCQDKGNEAGARELGLSVPIGPEGDTRP